MGLHLLDMIGKAGVGWGQEDECGYGRAGEVGGGGSGEENYTRLAPAKPSLQNFRRTR